MGINKFANLSDDKPVFHSTGYADAAHGTNIGSSSVQSFAERHHMERNRSSVGRYRDSMVAGGPGQIERESQITASSSPGRSRLQVGTRGPGSNISPVARPTFAEPPTRKYNPYA
jgi:hypothetical protein